MSLYTVRFTTRRIITSYDTARGVSTIETQHVEQVVSGLPLATAQSYSGCDNFRLEVEIPDMTRKPARRTSYQAPERQVAAPRVPPSRTPRKSVLATAAETGDLSAAISGAK